MQVGTRTKYLQPTQNDKKKKNRDFSLFNKNKNILDTTYYSYIY